MRVFVSLGLPMAFYICVFYWRVSYLAPTDLTIPKCHKWPCQKIGYPGTPIPVNDHHLAQYPFGNLPPFPDIPYGAKWFSTVKKFSDFAASARWNRDHPQGPKIMRKVKMATIFWVFVTLEKWHKKITVSRENMWTWFTFTVFLSQNFMVFLCRHQAVTNPGP